MSPRPVTSPTAAQCARNRRESDQVMRDFFEVQNERYREAGLKGMQVRIDADGNLDAAPSKPSEVNVVQTGAGEVAVMWKPARDDRGVKAYRIYRNGKLVATVRDGTWWSDRKADKARRYEVVAVDAGGLESAPGERRIGARMRAALQARDGADPADPAAAAANPTTAATQSMTGAVDAAAAPQAGAPAAAQPVPGDPAAQGVPPAAAASAPPQYEKMHRIDPTTFAISWAPVQGAVAYGIYQNGTLIGHTTDPMFGAQLQGSDPLALQVDAVMADGSRTPMAQPLVVRTGQEGIEVTGADGEPAGAAAPVAGQPVAGAPAQPVAAPQGPAAPATPAAAAPQAAAPVAAPLAAPVAAPVAAPAAASAP